MQRDRGIYDPLRTSAGDLETHSNHALLFALCIHHKTFTEFKRLALNNLPLAWSAMLRYMRSKVPSEVYLPRNSTDRRCPGLNVVFWRLDGCPEVHVESNFDQHVSPVDTPPGISAQYARRSGWRQHWYFPFNNTYEETNLSVRHMHRVLPGWSVARYSRCYPLLSIRHAGKQFGARGVPNGLRKTI